MRGIFPAFFVEVEFMAIAVVGDIHLGPKCERDGIRTALLPGMFKYHQQMISEWKARGIKTVLFSGDIFSNRAFITNEVLNYAIHLFSEDLKDFEVHVIPGNHDFLYENKESISYMPVLQLMPNVKVHMGIEKVSLVGRDWYMVPWIFPDKMPAVELWLQKLAKKSDEQKEKTVLFGHFDIMGCLMEAGQLSENGLSQEMLYNAANYVFSGHYHCRSYNKGPNPNSSILYMGTPYQLSFAHVGTDCGYYIVDEGENGKLSVEFIENTSSPRFVDVDDEHLEGLGDLSNCFVRYCYLNSRSADETRDRRKKLNDANPIYVKPVPYSDDVGIKKALELDDEETRRLLSADSLTLAEMYMDKHPEGLPTFWSKEDPKKKILGILQSYRIKT
jgi:DNA repair exonuclease SbcCD nuclease subunit